MTEQDEARIREIVREEIGAATDLARLQIRPGDVAAIAMRVFNRRDCKLI